MSVIINLSLQSTVSTHKSKSNYELGTIIMIYYIVTKTNKKKNRYRLLIRVVSQVQRLKQKKTVHGGRLYYCIFLQL